MSLNATPPLKTKLGRRRLLSSLAGIHVSPLCLGGMSIGDQWSKFGLGEMTKESSFALLDAFYDAGGNFIDTANNYQNGASEKFIGEWMEKRGVRDQMIVATKYTTPYVLARDDVEQKSSYIGNNTKSMRLSLEESLKNLRTSYIDILYVHWWDWTTSIEEVMNGLHNLVTSGQVLYLGVSDTPAWVVSQANTYARLTGKTPFVIYQGAWSVLQRDFEREIIPMARQHGMALAPWNVLHGGKIRTDEEEEQRRRTDEKGRVTPMTGMNWERDETQKKVAKTLEGIASEVGASNIQAVAIAYVMQKVPFVFPIVGGRKIEHLHANIQALDVVLTEEHIKTIESLVPFEPGFPTGFIGDGSDYGPWGWSAVGHFDRWPLPQAIRPHPAQ
ncbi:Aldo/keto reductase [Trametes polyzona]|nr:Aldo/keto reductase [Trametes polyzona]